MLAVIVVLRSEIGLQPPGVWYSSFDFPGFGMTTTRASLNLFGKCPMARLAVASFASACSTGSPHALRNPFGRVSGPGAFHGLAFRRAALMSSSVIHSSLISLGWISISFSVTCFLSSCSCSARWGGGLGKNLCLKRSALPWKLSAICSRVRSVGICAVSFGRKLFVLAYFAIF